jgi:hypothetical protein
MRCVGDIFVFSGTDEENTYSDVAILRLSGSDNVKVSLTHSLATFIGNTMYRKWHQLTDTLALCLSGSA